MTGERIRLSGSSKYKGRVVRGQGILIGADILAPWFINCLHAESQQILLVAAVRGMLGNGRYN